MKLARTMTDEELLAQFRAIVREENERLEARLRGERVPGQRRVKSTALAAKLAEEISGPVDEIAQARGRAAVERLRRRMTR
jgi:hypothetical protein